MQSIELELSAMAGKQVSCTKSADLMIKQLSELSVDLLNKHDNKGVGSSLMALTESIALELGIGYSDAMNIAEYGIKKMALMAVAKMVQS